MDTKIPLTHPGEILEKEFLTPLGLSQYRLAQDIGVTRRRINEIVLGRRSITADTAMRRNRYFGLGAKFWLNLQIQYDLDKAEEELGDRLEREVKIHSNNQQAIHDQPTTST